MLLTFNNHAYGGLIDLCIFKHYICRWHHITAML